MFKAQSHTLHYGLWRTVLLAVGLTPLASSALPPSIPPDLTLTVAGSTIQDNYLLKYLGQVCKPDTLDTYRDNDVVGGGTYYKAFYCAIDSNKLSGLQLQDPKVLILKRNRNGAITGVYPLLEPDKKISMMGIQNNVRSVGVTNPQCTETTPGSRNWNCRTDRSGDLIQVTPDLGVSDIDPQIFRGVNYMPTLDGQIFNEPTPAQVASTLKISSSGALVQGIIVSKNLRDALQSAQIVQNRLAPDCQGQDSEPCMPSLSKTRIASLFAGRIRRWSDLLIEYTPTDSTQAVAVSLTRYQGPGDTKVYLCRRNKGASTQAALNAYFLNNPCSSATSLTPVEISNPLAGPIVMTATQVTMEEDCVADFNDGTNNSKLNSTLTQGWAIGMMTTERNTGLGKNYRFIKIDDTTPTLQSVANGRYAYFSEATYHWRKLDPQPKGDLLTLIQKIATNASSPAIMASLNAGINQPWGQGTFIAVTAQGYPASLPFNPLNPVTPYTHSLRGGIDNCRLPQLDNSAAGGKSAL
jgi:hypothetical protein